MAVFGICKDIEKLVQDIQELDYAIEYNLPTNIYSKKLLAVGVGSNPVWYELVALMYSEEEHSYYIAFGYRVNLQDNGRTAPEYYFKHVYDDKKPKKVLDEYRKATRHNVWFGQEFVELAVENSRGSML